MRWLCFGAAVLMSASVMQGAPPAVAPSAPIPTTSESSISASAMQQTTAPRKARRSDRRRTEISKKTRRPAARGSGDVTPPRIDRLTPAPGRWIVDNLGLREIQIGFTEAVTVPVGAISVWTVGSGAVAGFTSSYDGTTDILTVSFASPIRDDRLTIVVDYSVADIAGNELDGEVADPMRALLPSGDGVRGGQAVFRINILQGDANRDGVVDGVDGNLLAALLGRCTDDTGFDATADLNLDGCVNIGDAAIFIQAEGRSLPATDGTPPIVTAIREPTNGLLDAFSTVIVDFDEIISGSRINERTCFLIDGSDNLIVPASGVSGPFGRTAVYNFVPPLAQCGTYTINISNALGDLSGELLVAPSAPPVLTGLIPPPAPTLDAHTTMTTATSVTITGSAPGATLVEVSCPTGVFTVPLTNDAFTADITLAPDSGNAIFFTALSTCSGVRSPPVMTTVTHDTQPPEIFIDFPTDGAQITTATTDVAGRVGDMLSGFMGLKVGIALNEGACIPCDSSDPMCPVEVDVGIGNNGTFFSGALPLIDGTNMIHVCAEDELGNSVTRQITVTQVTIPDGTSQMAVLSGNSQTAPVMTELPAPIVVQMTDTDGVTPFVNKVVTFKVTRSDGRLSSAPGFACIGDGTMMLQCHTDATGQAKALWTMGHDAGCGNNRVEATSMSIEGTVAFCASATAATASQLNIGSGTNQRAEAGGPAPQPLRVWVSDGQNGVNGQAVLFTVTRGGGMVNGQTATTVTTDMTGHAEVSFTLGPDWGNNVVEATLVVDPNPEMPQVARFVTFGVVRNEANPTSFIGVVLNNAMQPIGGATCTLTVGATTLPPVTSGLDGRFEFNDLSVAGSAHLTVDGSTATTVSGQPIDPAITYPSLPFEPVIIPNAVNALPAPVLLPPLETTAGVVFDNTQDITLTLAGLDGLEMLIRAGAARHPDGSVVDVANPVTLMLSQVHADDIPMPIPDGASPPFAWTLQPSGTTFDPPIEITYPNMSGLPAGSIAYFLSFNHATSRFEIVATGHVTDDGSRIVSDPGAGLSVAGWGCNCPPYSVTGDCCSGCDAACCDGSCCCGVCCAGPCCDGVCCAEGGSCCGGVCCDGPCCNGVCCPAGQTCVNGVCCDGPMCGGVCCSGSESCCGGQCCEGVCCEGLCCPAGGSCCDGKCCDGLCCEGQCCGPDDKSCCAGQCCAGACCAATGVCCPAGNESCCNDTCCNGPCCEGNCCAAGESCCGDQCCPAGENCCGGACCDGDCCNGVCCSGGGVCCDGQCCPPGNESCCNNACCEGPCCNDVCCSSGESCCGAAGCCAVGQTCCGDAGCCPTGSLCCEATGGGCCAQGTTCCGEACCPVGIVCCDGACCPAGQSCCGGDTCCEPDKCCDGLCCAPNEACCNGICELGSCSLSVQPEEGCPGSTVELTLTGDCDPDCDTMSFSMIKSVQFLAVNLPGPIPCLGSPHQRTFTVNIDPDAPPGPIVFEIIGTTGAAQCPTLVTVTVFGVDLDIDSDNNNGTGLPDRSDAEDAVEMTAPGKLLCVNDDDDDGNGVPDKDQEPPPTVDNDLVRMVMELDRNDPGGKWRLQYDASKVQVYEDDRATIVPSGLAFNLPVTPNPKNFWVEGIAITLGGPTTLTLQVDLNGDGTFDCSDAIVASVIRADLDGDADHDAVLNDQGPDDDFEDTLPGIIVLSNQDDDDSDSAADGMDNMVNSNGDADDLAPIVVRQIPGIPSNWIVRLTLENPTNNATEIDASEVVRIFPGNAPNTAALLGPGTFTVTFMENDPAHNADLVGLRNGDVTLYVEGLEFAAEVKLRLEVMDNTGTLMCEDRVQFKATPYIMLPNTALPTRVLVANNDAAFLATITGLAGAASVITTTVGDQWPQDAWELGVSSAPYQSGAMSFETLRAFRALEAWGRTNLLGPTPSDPNRTGLIERPAPVDDALAYGGNLEVTPPLPNEALGRIVVGAMPQVQKDFLIRQGVQTPLIELNTTWLDVGHIDEFLAFAPVGSTSAWQVVWSDPLQGMALLTTVPNYEPLFYDSPTAQTFVGTATGGTANTLVDANPGVDFTAGPAWQYIRIYDGPGVHQIAEIVGIQPNTLTIGTVWKMDDGEELEQTFAVGPAAAGTVSATGWFPGFLPSALSKYVLATGSKDWLFIHPTTFVLEQWPALVTAGELALDTFLQGTNNAADVRIIEAQSVINPALVGSGAFQATVPALYFGNPGTPRSMFAFVPGLVNLQVWGGQLWLPRPFGPRIGGADVFETAAQNALGAANVVFVDDWDWYHALLGEVHCGTNVIRVPPDEYRQWWDSLP